MTAQTLETQKRGAGGGDAKGEQRQTSRLVVHSRVNVTLAEDPCVEMRKRHLTQRVEPKTISARSCSSICKLAPAWGHVVQLNRSDLQGRGEWSGDTSRSRSGAKLPPSTPQPPSLSASYRQVDKLIGKGHV